MLARLVFLTYPADLFPDQHRRRWGTSAWRGSSSGRCSRRVAAPREEACVLDIDKDAGTIEQIEKQIIYRALQDRVREILQRADDVAKACDLPPRPRT